LPSTPIGDLFRVENWLGVRHPSIETASQLQERLYSLPHWLPNLGRIAT
jgi:hypothetical protein